MQVYEVARPATGEGAPVRVAVLGTCRVTDPFVHLAALGAVAKIWGNDGAGLYSLGEAKQLLEFTEGLIDIPPYLRRFIFPAPELIPPPDPAHRRPTADVEYLVVEMSDHMQVRFRDFFLNRNCFTDEFLTKKGAALLPWFRLVSVGQAAPEDVVQRALDKIAGENAEERHWTEAMLREVRFETITPQSTAAAISALTAERAAKWLFVSHFLVPGATPESMAERQRTIDCLRWASAETGTAFFDPSAIVARAGRQTALDQNGDDIYHYAVNFNATVGDGILEAMLGRRKPEAEGRASIAAAALNRTLVALHERRVERLGVDGSGLFEYYKTLLDRGEIVGRRECEIAEFVTRFLPRFATYHVLRAGLGELAFLLADLGCKTVAFDIDRARHQALSDGARDAARTRGWPRGRLEVRRQDFPDPAKGGETLCIAAQGPFSVPVEAEDVVFDTIARYDSILFSPRSFIRIRETHDEQAVLIEKLRARGMFWIEDCSAQGLVLCARRNLRAPR